jgi:hypothetical protein
MVEWLTWDQVRPLGESGGSLIGKGEESDVESRLFQGCSSHLCQLRTDGLASVSKCWTYWSHTRDMRPVNRCSLFVNRCLALAYYFNGCVGRETRAGPTGHSAGLRGGVGSTFSREQLVFIQFYWVSVKGCHIRKLAWKAYVSCVSGFPCKVYIDLNYPDSRIWVTTWLVVVSM